ncbi:hypothetical protein JA1_002042 [Spathaspora sp. JA1]|nr:hypothetical protein JA1_002042 [Spathaspora sp. JA1]
MSFYNSNQSLVYSPFRTDHLQPQQPEGNSTTGPNNATVAANAAAAVVVQQGEPIEQPEQQQQQHTKKLRQNKPGVKFGAKKRSWVWVWFVQDSTNPNIAACDYCGKIIVRLASDKGSPKKLSEHLKVHKLDAHSINYSRSVPSDGFGVTYNHNGQPISYPDNYERGESHRPEDQDQEQLISVQQDVLVEPTPTLKKQKTSANNASLPPQSNNAFELGTTPRYLCADFDNTPYSSMKFHKHLLKFLTDNKLPISVIKSQSFQQLVYDLRSNSIEDLLELTGLYNSLIEVSGYDARESNESDNHAVNALNNIVTRHTQK